MAAEEKGGGAVEAVGFETTSIQSVQSPAHASATAYTAASGAAESSPSETPDSQQKLEDPNMELKGLILPCRVKTSRVDKKPQQPPPPPQQQQHRGPLEAVPWTPTQGIQRSPSAQQTMMGYMAYYTPTHSPYTYPPPHSPHGPNSLPAQSSCPAHPLSDWSVEGAMESGRERTSQPASPLGSPVSTPTAMLFPKTPFASHAQFYRAAGSGRNPFANPEAHHHILRNNSGSFNATHIRSNSSTDPHANYFHPMFNTFPPFVQMSLQPPPPPPSPRLSGSVSISSAAPPPASPPAAALYKRESLPRLPSSISYKPSFIDIASSPQHSFSESPTKGGCVMYGAYPSGADYFNISESYASPGMGVPNHSSPYKGTTPPPPPPPPPPRRGHKNDLNQVHGKFYGQQWVPGTGGMGGTFLPQGSPYGSQGSTPYGSPAIDPSIMQYHMIKATAGLQLPPYQQIAAAGGGLGFMGPPPPPPPSHQKASSPPRHAMGTTSMAGSPNPGGLLSMPRPQQTGVRMSSQAPVNAVQGLQNYYTQQQQQMQQQQQQQQCRAVFGSALASTQILSSNAASVASMIKVISSAHAAGPLSPTETPSKPRRNLLEPKVGPDGTPRLNSRQRRTLRRAKERAIKGLMEAGHILLQTHDSAGTLGTEGELSDADKDAVYNADKVGIYLNAALSVAAGSDGPAAAAASSQTLSKITAELQSADISELISQIALKEKEGLVDEYLIKDLQIIQTLIGALNRFAVLAGVSETKPTAPSPLDSSWHLDLGPGTGLSPHCPPHPPPLVQ